jgi:diadenosine tetraphosphate (Ap4A) HIT family hydrolase
MTETSKAKRKQPARKAKAVAQPQKPTTIPFPDTDSEEEANRILAKNVPDWENLDKDERAELLRLIRDHRKRGAPAKVKMTRKPDGGWSIEPTGKSEMLALLKLHETFSANSIDPVNARANELLKYLGSVGADNEAHYNAALSFIESMEPRDQAEALLLVQMYVTHDAAIRALSQLGSAEWVPTAQMYGNLATKLLRTSQGQMETLTRMRRGGEQVVRHVHVDNRGGQAVIAENVHTGGKGNGKMDDQSHATGAAGIGPALLGADPFGNGVPIPSCERAEAVPYARGHESRCA